MTERMIKGDHSACDVSHLLLLLLLSVSVLSSEPIRRQAWVGVVTFQ